MGSLPRVIKGSRMCPPRSAWTRLLLVLGVCGLLVGLVWYSVRAIEQNFWTPHPSEAQIAKHILELGGAYHIDKSNDRHITGVWLSGTRTSDSDVELIMQLPFLTAVEFDNTQVTDASLPVIFSHPTLRTIRLAGSGVSSAHLSDALEHSMWRIKLDE